MKEEDGAKVIERILIIDVSKTTEITPRKDGNIPRFCPFGKGEEGMERIQV